MALCFPMPTAVKHEEEEEEEEEDLSLGFRDAWENVACVDPTALLDQKKSFATEKQFNSENSDAITTLLRNVDKLVVSLLSDATAQHC